MIFQMLQNQSCRLSKMLVIGMSDAVARAFLEIGDDTDKNNAYRTLHYVLAKLAVVMAPFTPFLSEELYQKLVGDESVHLLDWPVVGHVNKLVVDEMSVVRIIVNESLAKRAKEGIKIRQPLSKVKVYLDGEKANIEIDDEAKDIIKEEINVKEVEVEYSKKSNVKWAILIDLDTVITQSLKVEGLMREIIRSIQNSRKEAGLIVDDRINLTIFTENKEFRDAIAEYKDTIMAETLALDLSDDIERGWKIESKIEGVSVTISLEKATKSN